MGGFCLVVELTHGGSVIKEAVPIYFRVWLRCQSRAVQWYEFLIGQNCKFQHKSAAPASQRQFVI